MRWSSLRYCPSFMNTSRRLLRRMPSLLTSMRSTGLPAFARRVLALSYAVACRARPSPGQPEGEPQSISRIRLISCDGTLCRADTEILEGVPGDTGGGAQRYSGRLETLGSPRDGVAPLCLSPWRAWPDVDQPGNRLHHVLLREAKFLVRLSHHGALGVRGFAVGDGQQGIGRSVFLREQVRRGGVFFSSASSQIGLIASTHSSRSELTTLRTKPGLMPRFACSRS